MKDYLFKSVLYLVIFISCLSPGIVKPANELSQQSPPSEALSPNEICQISEVAQQAIDSALSAWEKSSKAPKVLDLILEAEAASKPPECDTVRAKILADEAMQLVNEIEDNDQTDVYESKLIEEDSEIAESKGGQVQAQTACNVS